MGYTLTSASTLGLDLARRPGGVEAAGVLVAGLRHAAADGPASPDADPTATGRATDRSADRAAALQLLGADSPLAVPPPRDVLDLSEGDRAAHGEAGPGRLREVLRGLLAVGFGTVEDLLALARSLPDRDRPSGLHLRDAATVRAGEDLADRVLAALLDASPAGPGAQALVARLRAPLHGSPPVPAAGRAYCGPNEELVHDLLDRVARASTSTLLRVGPGDLAPNAWSERMHAASWAVELTGRTRAAAAAQLDLLRCLAHHPLGADDLLRGLWNALSAGVQAQVVHDVLDSDTRTVLLGDLLDLV